MARNQVTPFRVFGPHLRVQRAATCPAAARGGAKSKILPRALARILAAAEVGSMGRAKKRAHGRGGFRVSMPSSVGGGLVRGAHSACGVTPFLALDTCVTQINFTG